MAFGGVGIPKEEDLLRAVRGVQRGHVQAGERPRPGGGGAIHRGDVVLQRGGGKGASRLLLQGTILLRGGAGAGVVADRPTAGRGARGERAGICSAGTAAENAGTAQGERVGSGVWTGIIQCELLVRGGAQRDGPFAYRAHAND